MEAFQFYGFCKELSICSGLSCGQFSCKWTADGVGVIILSYELGRGR